MPSSVFLSSTCYDLLDLRAELDRHLTGQGLRVVRSDAHDFQVEPDRNSIETCLCRVRDTDYFVCILSQRYGPSLLKAGYDDVSATELEYRTARESKKEILFFVRDRLFADYALWKKSGAGPEIHPAFAQSKDALSLFRFIDAHAELAKDSDVSNWISSFATVVDLKAALEQRLDAPMRRARLQRLLDAGQLPLFDVRTKHALHDAGGVHGRPQSWKVTISIEHMGQGAALNARFGIYNSDALPWQPLGSIAAGGAVETTLSLARPLKPPGRGKPLIAAIDFSLPSGEMLELLYTMQLDKEGTPTRFIPRGATLVQGTGFKLHESWSRGQGA